MHRSDERRATRGERAPVIRKPVWVLPGALVLSQ